LVSSCAQNVGTYTTYGTFSTAKSYCASTLGRSECSASGTGTSARITCGGVCAANHYGSPSSGPSTCAPSHPFNYFGGKACCDAHVPTTSESCPGGGFQWCDGTSTNPAGGCANCDTCSSYGNITSCTSCPSGKSNDGTGLTDVSQCLSPPKKWNYVSLVKTH
jgi:hypothetical protein